MTQISLPRTAGRAGLAAAAAAFLAFGMAAPAAADPDGEPTRASYSGQATAGIKVDMEGSRNAHTTLFQLDLAAGGFLKTYCIDLETPIPRDYPVPYIEGQWSEYPGKGDFKAESGKVLWVLENSYPTIDVNALASAAGVEKLSEKEAIAATQAAIWHFSNGSALTGVPDKKHEATIVAVYDYLVGNATPVSEPAPALTVTPGTAEGEAGSKVGEFVIETNATSVPVVVEAPEGVTLVDLETGEPVSTVENGDKVGFDVPADAEAGEASFSLSASATVSAGRLFQGEGVTTQTLITAEDQEISVSASASATWTAGGGEEPTPSPSPSEEPSETPEPTPTPSESPSTPASPKPSSPADDRPSLPVTGGALAGLVAAGIAALGAGGGAIYLSRKRKAAGTSTED